MFWENAAKADQRNEYYGRLKMIRIVQYVRKDIAKMLINLLWPLMILTFRYSYHYATPSS